MKFICGLWSDDDIRSPADYVWVKEYSYSIRGCDGEEKPTYVFRLCKGVMKYIDVSTKVIVKKQRIGIKVSRPSKVRDILEQHSLAIRTSSNIDRWIATWTSCPPQNQENQEQITRLVKYRVDVTSIYCAVIWLWYLKFCSRWHWSMQVPMTMTEYLNPPKWDSWITMELKDLHWMKDFWKMISMGITKTPQDSWKQAMTTSSCWCWNHASDLLYWWVNLLWTESRTSQCGLRLSWMWQHDLKSKMHCQNSRHMCSAMLTVY